MRTREEIERELTKLKHRRDAQLRDKVGVTLSHYARIAALEWVLNERGI